VVSYVRIVLRYTQALVAGVWDMILLGTNATVFDVDLDRTNYIDLPSSINSSGKVTLAARSGQQWLRCNEGVRIVELMQSVDDASSL
jgi:hypothetical protein